MARALALLLLCTAGGCLDVTLGAEDGIAQVRYEDTFTGLPGNLAHAPDGDRQIANTRGDVMTLTLSTAPDGSRRITVAGTLEVYSAERAAHELERFGPDKIGALREVRLTRVQAQYDGLDLARAPEPTVTVGSRELRPVDDGVDLDGDTVHSIRVDLLTPQAVRVPLLFTLTIPAAAPDALGGTLHILLVFQPLLTVDAGRTL